MTGEKLFEKIWFLLKEFQFVMSLKKTGGAWHTLYDIA